MNPQQNAFGDTVFVISGSFPWKSTEPDSLGAFLGVGGLLFGNEIFCFFLGGFIIIRVFDDKASFPRSGGALATPEIRGRSISCYGLS